MAQKAWRRPGLAPLGLGGLSGIAIGAALEPWMSWVMAATLIVLATVVAVVTDSVPRLRRSYAVPAVCLASGLFGTLAAASGLSSVGTQLAGAVTALAMGALPFVVIHVGGRVARHSSVLY